MPKEKAIWPSRMDIASDMYLALHWMTHRKTHSIANSSIGGIIRHWIADGLDESPKTPTFRIVSKQTTRYRAITAPRLLSLNRLFPERFSPEHPHIYSTHHRFEEMAAVLWNCQCPETRMTESLPHCLSRANSIATIAASTRCYRWYRPRPLPMELPHSFGKLRNVEFISASNLGSLPTFPQEILYALAPNKASKRVGLETMVASKNLITTVHL